MSLHSFPSLITHDEFQTVALAVLLALHLWPSIERLLKRAVQMIKLRRLGRTITQRRHTPSNPEADAACDYVAHEAKRRIHVIRNEVQHDDVA